MPSAASCRCSRGAGPARSPATPARATARTAPGTSRAACPAPRGRCSSRCRRRRRRATASTRSRTRRTSCSTPTPTATATGACRRTLGFTVAPEQELTGAVFPQPARQSVRRRPGFRRPHDHGGRDLAGREPQPAGARSGCRGCRRAPGSTTARRRRRTAISPFKTTQRQYAWQNEFTLPAGALTAGVERREEHVATDAGFATTERNTNSLFGIYQLRVDGARAAGQSAPRRFEPVRREDHRRLRLRLPLRAVAARHGGLRHRLQGAVVQRSLLPGLRQSRPRAGDVEESRGGRLLERRCRGREPRSARDRLPQPGVAADRVSVRRRLSTARRTTSIARRSKA